MTMRYQDGMNRPVADFCKDKLGAWFAACVNKNNASFSWNYPRKGHPSLQADQPLMFHAITLGEGHSGGNGREHNAR
jgi:hypothetical protein